MYGFKGNDTYGIKVLKRVIVDKVLPKCKMDSGVFDIADVSAANLLLRFIFVNEIRLLKYIKYPPEVSVSAVLVK